MWTEVSKSEKAKNNRGEQKQKLNNAENSSTRTIRSFESTSVHGGTQQHSTPSQVTPQREEESSTSPKSTKRAKRKEPNTYNFNTIYSTTTSSPSTPPSPPPPLLTDIDLLPMWNIRKRGNEEPDRSNNNKRRTPQHRRLSVDGEELLGRTGEGSSVEVMEDPVEAGEDHIEPPPEPPPELSPPPSQRSTTKRKAKKDGQEKEHPQKKHHGLNKTPMINKK